MTEKKAKKTTTKKVSSDKVIAKVASDKVKKAVAKSKESKKIVQAEDKQVFVVKKAIVKNVKKEGEDTKKVVSGNVVRATGKRKSSVAKVACARRTGNVEINVNEMEYNKYFTKLIHQQTVFAPFALLGIKSGYVVNAEVFGGGKTGQSDALKLGLSKCLSLLSEDFSVILRKNSFLTRDARQVEPKKYGLKKARKKEQFSKR